MLLSGERKSPPEKTAAFRRLLAEKTVVMPGTFNAAIGMLAESIGFEAIYISGAGLINGTAGYPDIGLLGMEEIVRQAGYIADAVDIPAIADADTGFGDVLQVMRTIRAFEGAGVAGVHLEDQQAPKRCGHLEGKSLVSVAEMERKLGAAAKARRNPDFTIIARTDARSVEGFDSSVERGLRYLEAGADAIFPEAMETAEEFGLYAEKVQAPLLANMTEFGKTPNLTAAQFSDLGYRMVIFPMTVFRVAMKAAEGVLREIKEKGTPSDYVEDRMQTRKELYELLQYERYVQTDNTMSDIGKAE